MNKKFLRSLVVLIVVGALCVGSVVPVLANGQASSPTRAIVFIESEAVNELARQGVDDQGGLVLKELATGSGLVVLIPEHAWDKIVNIPGVIAIEPDLKLHAVAPPPGKGKPDKEPPPQPEEELPWGIDRIYSDLVWDTDGDLAIDDGANIGSGIKVAIIDSGIDADHPDLVNNIGDGVNFIATGKGPPWKRTVDPTKWDDDYGHGTHVAGIVAAVENDIGVIGVAPGASLYAVKVLDNTGSGYISDVINGIYWAADNGIEVINLSLGIEKEILDLYPNDKELLEDAVDYAYYQKNVVVVAAAGNEGAGEDTVIYPARFASVIAVVATDNADNRASFSSTGDTVEMAAPGASIFSTWNDGYYDTASGTSMAAPHVAGTAALVISTGITDATMVRITLQGTAEDLGSPVLVPDPLYGYGLVDAEGAVE